MASFAGDMDLGAVITGRMSASLAISRNRLVASEFDSFSAISTHVISSPPPHPEWHLNCQPLAPSQTENELRLSSCHGQRALFLTCSPRPYCSISFGSGSRRFASRMSSFIARPPARTRTPACGKGRKKVELSWSVFRGLRPKPSERGTRPRFLSQPSCALSQARTLAT